MVHTLIMARYTPEQLSAFVKEPEGMVQREQHAHQFYGAFGGEVAQAFYIRSLEWHFMVIVSFPNAAAAHAAVTVGAASGAFEKGELYFLASFEEGLETMKLAQRGASAFAAPAG